MKNIRKEKGITLISLVITIIVLVILAGVAISSLMGTNGIITRAKQAKIQTEKGQIQEILDMALIESKMLGKDENGIFEFAKEELEKKGYQIKTVADDESSSVQNINLSETEIQVKEGASKVITVTVEETPYTNRYYVEIEKKYFEIIQNGEEIKIAENETDLDNITEEREITVTGANYSTVEINQSTKEITITGGQNLGTDTLIVQYGEKQATCKVEVGLYITSLSLATSDGTKITNGMEIELELEEGLTINATTNSDATEKITWTCSNTSITSITVSNDKKTVNLTGNTVGTSTITASTAKVKISFTVKVIEEEYYPLISDITAENYGDVIVGYEANEVSEWKVFLNDGNNVWIIASDYVRTGVPVSANKYANGSEYGIKWSGFGSTVDDPGNKRCVGYLTGKSYWAAFVNEDYASKAMGGPTMEMFAESYNGKYSDSKILYDIAGSNYGYAVKFSNDTSWYWALTGLVKDPLYVIKSTEKREGYWLACPNGWRIRKTIHCRI